MKQKLLTLSKRLIKSELVSGSVFLFAGTMANNIFSFIFNLVLVRHVSYAEYAEITAIISLITLASIPTLAFGPTIIQFAGKYFAKDQTREAGAFFYQSSRTIGIFALLFLVGFTIFSPFLAQFLHISNPVEIAFGGLIVSVMYLGITNTAFIQSLLQFPFLAFTLALGGLLKLVVALGLLFAGFGVFGILWGYFMAFFIPLIVSFYPIKHLVFAKWGELPTGHTREILTYGLPATVAMFALSSFTSTDILLVKHFFPSNMAAMYSGLSLVGRIIFYFSAPISSVMFPVVIKRFHKGDSVHKLLYASFFLVLLPSLGLSTFYFLFPKFMISLLLGVKYFAIAPLLGWFGLYLSIFSLLSVVVNFLLSIKKTSVAIFIATGAILQIIGISLFHYSLAAVVTVSLILSLVLFVALLIYYQGTYVNKSQASQ